MVNQKTQRGNAFDPLAMETPDALPMDQPVSATQRQIVDRAYALFEYFRRQSARLRRRAADCRKIYLLEDPEQDAPGTPTEARAAQLHTLKSTVTACIADQMDNMPEAALLPEQPQLQSIAEDLTDIVRFVMDKNQFERLHRQRVTDFFLTGTSVTQVTWDPDMHGGEGEVALVRRPIENFYWDPACEDIQDARALFVATFHPRSWYAQHYPDAAPYLQADAYAMEERLDATREGQFDGIEEDILMLEYWYRVYDAKTRRSAIHVAYIAGHALLYSSEEAHPQGLYHHGRYPFVLDVFTHIEGQPVGNGMIHEFAPMQRYINRYAKYIDENTRMSAKVRLLVNHSAGIEDADLTDWNRNIIKGDNIGEGALRWFQSAPLSGQAHMQMASFQDQIKMDSGQNQFSRGEGGRGVTAASAIVALQEAGGKTSRLHTASLNDGFREMVEMILWLIAEFYDKPRTRLITGRAEEEPRNVEMSGARMMRGDSYAMGKPDDLPAPPYTVQVQVQRRNPARQQAQNEFILQMAQISGQSGQPIPPLKMAELLQMDGKDRLLPALRELDQTQQMMQMLTQKAEEATMAAEQLAQKLEGVQRLSAKQGQMLMQFQKRMGSTRPSKQPATPQGLPPEEGMPAAQGMAPAQEMPAMPGPGMPPML